jgi:Ca-activated chloride channel homolog
MSNPPRKRRGWLLLVVLLLLLLVVFLLARCRPDDAAAVATDSAPASGPDPVAEPATPAPARAEEDERLTEATLEVPAEIAAGAAFPVAWTGPDNPRDYVTIVARGTPDGQYQNFRDTRHGTPLSLTAPLDAGDYEVRYVAGRSRTVLARVPVVVMPVEATVSAPERAIAGAPVVVVWTGPDNANDYITIVPEGTPDTQYRNYVYTKQGSPVTVAAVIDTGPAEVRYVTGQGPRVLARRPIQIVAAEVTLAAPAEAVAGSPVIITWNGPNHANDYITIVPASVPDGQYRNYRETRHGSPFEVLAPIDHGPAEIRYVSGQGARVLARRPLQVRAAEIRLTAPAEVKVNEPITVEWVGPDNANDYITVVAAGTPDGRYQNYAETRRGSPMMIKALPEAGEAELRYMSGQGARVLARRPIRIVTP